MPMSDGGKLRDRVFLSLFSRLFVFTVQFEDAEIEERYFGLGPDSRVLAVSAAGCGVGITLPTPMGMSTTSPTSIWWARKPPAGCSMA